MDKILSKDTIKNVFSALGAKTSDSNYGVALLDKTSGEPKGFMGMSDLASVLGVVPSFKRGINKAYSQCDTLESGLFFVGDIKGAFSDADQGYSGVILALQYNESSCLQLAFRMPVEQYGLVGAAFRIKWGDSWSKWFRFNYS